MVHRCDSHSPRCSVPSSNRCLRPALRGLWSTSQCAAGKAQCVNAKIDQLSLDSPNPPSVKQNGEGGCAAQLQPRAQNLVFASRRYPPARPLGPPDYASMRRKKCANTLATRFNSRGVAEPGSRMSVVIRKPPPWKFAISIRSRRGFIQLMF